MKHLILYCLLFFTLSVIGQNARTELETFVPNKENYSFTTIRFNVPAFHWKQKIDSVYFEGSLITPKTGFDKVVIIKPGTGYNTRNTHSPLAETLLDNNIAVFRYDERGMGNSQGVAADMLNTATMMGAELARAFQTLKGRTELKDKKIGVIGHSMGGVAVMDAYNHSFAPDFLVLLSSPVVSGREMFLYQLRQENSVFQDYFAYDTQEEKERVYHELVDFYIANHNEKNYWKLYKKKTKEIGYTKKRYKARYGFLIGAVEKDFLIKDIKDKYKAINVPTFFMMGSEDLVVDPISNVELLKSLNNNNIKIEIASGENHLFSDGEDYNMHEDIKQKIVDWVLKQ